MKIKIGTRKSRLAVAQSLMVADKIKELYPDAEIELKYITTEGDRIIDKPLAYFGGKGVFVSDIEKAILTGEADIAVHSAKDLPVQLAGGLEISGVLKRGNYRDVLVTTKDKSINENSDLVAGTGSARRRNNLKKLYPNIRFKDIRGNVDTRLNKLAKGEYDCIVLAAAGLERLGCETDGRFNIRSFEYTEFLPAPCQGIIAIESRKNDFVTPVIQSISDQLTFLSFETERYIIETSGADCGMPLGAYTFTAEDKITAVISKDNGKTVEGTDLISNRFKLVKELLEEL